MKEMKQVLEETKVPKCNCINISQGERKVDILSVSGDLCLTGELGYTCTRGH